jgi:hypothetical protein
VARRFWGLRKSYKQAKLPLLLYQYVRGFALELGVLVGVGFMRDITDAGTK